MFTHNFGYPHHNFFIIPLLQWSYDQYPTIFSFNPILINYHLMTSQISLAMIMNVSRYGGNYEMNLIFFTYVSLLMTVLSDIIVLILPSLGRTYNPEYTITGLKQLQLSNSLPGSMTFTSMVLFIVVCVVKM